MKKKFEIKMLVEGHRTHIAGDNAFATITFHRYLAQPIKIMFDSTPQSTDELLDLKNALDSYIEVREKFNSIKSLESHS